MCLHDSSIEAACNLYTQQPAHQKVVSQFDSPLPAPCQSRSCWRITPSLQTGLSLIVNICFWICSSALRKTWTGTQSATLRDPLWRRTRQPLPISTIGVTPLSAPWRSLRQTPAAASPKSCGSQNVLLLRRGSSPTWASTGRKGPPVSTWWAPSPSLSSTPWTASVGPNQPSSSCTAKVWMGRVRRNQANSLCTATLFMARVRTNQAVSLCTAQSTGPRHRRLASSRVPWRAKQILGEWGEFLLSLTHVIQFLNFKRSE